jgi:MFS family permease
MHRHYFPFRPLRPLYFTKKFAQLPKSVKYCCLLFFIYYLGWGMMLAYEPIYLKNVLGQYSNIGLIATSFHILALIMSLSMGAVLDRIRKKKFLSFFLLCYLPFSYLYLHITKLWHFLLFKAYHGIIATGLWISGEAYVRAHSPKGKEIESIALFDIAAILALVLGSFVGATIIGKLSFNIFYAISLFAIFALIFSLWLPDEEKESIKKIEKIELTKGIKKEIKDLRKNKKFRSSLPSLLLYVFVSGSLGLVLPLFLKTLNAQLWLIGIFYGIFQAPFLFESVFATAKKKNRVLLMGWIASCLIFFAMFFLKSISTTFLASLLLGISFAAISPILSGRITTAMPKTRRGEYTGILAALRYFILTLSSLVFGFMADAISLRSIFLLNFFLIVVMLITMMIKRVK